MCLLFEIIYRKITGTFAHQLVGISLGFEPVLYALNFFNSFVTFTTVRRCPGEMQKSIWSNVTITLCLNFRYVCHSKLLFRKSIENNNNCERITDKALLYYNVNAFIVSIVPDTSEPLRPCNRSNYGLETTRSDGWWMLF